MTWGCAQNGTSGPAAYASTVAGSVERVLWVCRSGATATSLQQGSDFKPKCAVPSAYAAGPDLVGAAGIRPDLFNLETVHTCGASGASVGVKNNCMLHRGLLGRP